MRRAVVGPGPAQTLVLADGDVLVAAAGLKRPRVVVSAGALLTFDDGELAASLEHEHGHIARRHRYVLVGAELGRALARFLPGRRQAAEELVFHLERDADRYAVARINDPAALASAICKASQSAALGAAALALGGGAVSRRIRLLLDGDATPPRRRELPLRVLATAMVALVTLSAAALPAAARAGWTPRRRARRFPSPDACSQCTIVDGVSSQIGRESGPDQRSVATRNGRQLAALGAQRPVSGPGRRTGRRRRAAARPARARRACLRRAGRVRSRTPVPVGR